MVRGRLGRDTILASALGAQWGFIQVRGWETPSRERDKGRRPSANFRPTYTKAAFKAIVTRPTALGPPVLSARFHGRGHAGSRSLRDASPNPTFVTPCFLFMSALLSIECDEQSSSTTKTEFIVGIHLIDTSELITTIAQLCFQRPADPPISFRGMPPPPIFGLKFQL
ncbi:hypothetical protein RhiLY_09920 [Ceratobasidium sp. AG-Ba]|nr:hypothetical protein RhiLY_09920 [Ceratobasidium sp. AG-Ba]